MFSQPQEGSTRMVVVGEREVIKVVKGAVPSFDFLEKDEARKCIESYFTTGKREHLESLANIVEIRHAKSIKDARPEQGDTASLQMLLDKQIAANQLEASPPDDISVLVVPTRFSVRGLVNIQDFAARVPYAPYRGKNDKGDFYRQKQLFTKMGLSSSKFGHTIGNEENFGIHEGVIKLRDYAHPELIPVLVANRIQIRAALDEFLLTIQATV